MAEQDLGVRCFMGSPGHRRVFEDLPEAGVILVWGDRVP